MGFEGERDWRSAPFNFPHRSAMYLVTAQDSPLALENRLKVLGSFSGGTSEELAGILESSQNHGTEDTGIVQIFGMEGACADAVKHIVRQ